MKKWLIYLIAGILVLAVGLSTFFIVRANTKDDVLGGTYSKVEYFHETQHQSQLGVFHAYAVGENFTRMSYKLDNGAEVDIEFAEIDDATSDWEYYEDSFKGKRYVDSGVITLDFSEMEVGDHFLQIFVYNGTEQECIYKQFFVLKA